MRKTVNKRTNKGGYKMFNYGEYRIFCWMYGLSMCKFSSLQAFKNSLIVD